MVDSNKRLKTEESGLARAFEMLRRAFAEFLLLPTAIIIGFFVLALASYLLDGSDIAWLAPFRRLLTTHIFLNAKATSDLLGTVAGSLITVTSITISLLLVALQQAAGSLTTEVFDQFLRRKLNQFYFGFFVGLSLFSLVTLATVHEHFNPVFGATLAFLLTTVALYLLILLLYTTINQMRPVEIIEEIHRHTLLARSFQLRLLRKTRRVSQSRASARVSVKAERHGYVTRVDVDVMGDALRRAGDDAEAILFVAIGSFVAFGDTIAEVKAGTLEGAKKLEPVVLCAIHLERQRDVALDAAYGIEQLETIAWTSISTAKSNPAPGRLTIHSLRDVLARWSIEEETGEDRHTREEPMPIVYTDNTLTQLMDAFENFAVVSTESMQHQNFLEVVHTLGSMLERLPLPQQRRAEDIVLRVLAGLGDLVLTDELERTLDALIAKLRAVERCETADAVESARDQLRRSVGRLNSRSTRVPDR